MTGSILIRGDKLTKRCEWVPEDNELYREYHDSEWGVPVHDDRLLFEKIILDGVQAGLSWLTVLKKRERYRKVYDNFDVLKVSQYNCEKINELLNDKGIIRNRLKINSSISNAEAFIRIQKEFGSFDEYIWGFVNGKTITNKRKFLSEIPTRSEESDLMSIDLKKRGFKFTGTTICYAFMQATGLVNDHTIDCFRYKEVKSFT